MTTNDRADESGLPEDLDPGLKSFQDACRTAFFVLKVVMVILLAAYLFSGFFRVRESERAVIMRFGKLVKDSEGGAVRGSGLNAALPYPIDEYVRYPALIERTVPIDTYWQGSVPSGGPPAQANLLPGGHALTGDLNIVHYRWVARYVISDFPTFFANFRDADLKGGFDDADRLVANVVCSAVVRVTARTGVDDAYLRGRESLKAAVLRESRARLAALPGGSCIELRSADLPAATPPPQVKKAFDDVVAAESNSQEKIRQAQGRAAEIVNGATGEATVIKAEAEAEAADIVKSAEADSGYVQAIAEKYRGRPEALSVFLKQIYLETVEVVLDGAQEKFVLPSIGGDDKREIRYRLTRDPEAVRNLEKEEMEKQKAAEAEKAER